MGRVILFLLAALAVVMLVSLVISCSGSPSWPWSSSARCD
jgi:hypothetical protein